MPFAARRRFSFSQFSLAPLFALGPARRFVQRDNIATTQLVGKRQLLAQIRENLDPCRSASGAGFSALEPDYPNLRIDRI